METEMLELLKDIDGRLKKIETLLTGGSAMKLTATTEKMKANTKQEAKDYSGLAGGVRFLIDRGFFSSPKTAAEVIEELGREGYHHQPAPVRKTLGVDFTNKKKLLSRILQDGVYKYAVRK